MKHQQEEVATAVTQSEETIVTETEEVSPLLAREPVRMAASARYSDLNHWIREPFASIMVAATDMLNAWFEVDRARSTVRDFQMFATSRLDSVLVDYVRDQRIEDFSIEGSSHHNGACVILELKVFVRHQQRRRSRRGHWEHVKIKARDS